MDSIAEIAEQTITRVLEGAAFIFTDPLAESDIPLLQTWEADGVSLKFKGKPTGMMHLWVSEGFACSIAANMLGIDMESEIAKEKGLDALKELLNMIVGNLMTAAFGEEPVFELGLPERIDRSLLESHGDNPHAIWLQADDNPVLFLIEIDPAV